MTIATIHMPAELLNALRHAAMRRSMRRIGGQLADGKNTRPSVSEIVVDMLQRHRNVSTTLIHPGSAFRLGSSGLTLVD